MLETVSHYAPNAMAIFVSGFQGVPGDDNTIIASNIGEIKEIAAINVTLTVRNAPGSFSLEIADTANKFIIPDEPATEIQSLYKYSQRKKLIATQNENKYGDNPIKEFDRSGTYYPHTDWSAWKDYFNYTLTDPRTSLTFPLYFTRDRSGTVREIWGYDAAGQIVTISDIDEALAVDTGTIIVASNNFKYVLNKISNESFLRSFKDTDEQGRELASFKRGRCKISPMDRVVIFMSERFVDDPMNPDLGKAFTGVVNSVQQGYSENRNTISIQGEDITKFMKLSIINVNPALLLDQASAIDQTKEEKITIWSTILKGLTAPNIIRLLTLGSEFVIEPGRGLNRKIDGIGTYTVSDAIPRGTKIKFSKSDNVFYEITKSKTRSGNTFGSNKVSFRNALGALFTEHTVHVIDPYKPGSKLKGFRPYELSLNSSWSFYQADFKTRREIAYKVAEDTHFVFYADRHGEIWFHPPRFDKSWILSATNPKVYVIDTPSILDFGFIETDENVFSSVYVNTEAEFALESTTELGFYTASFRDDGIVLKYGQRLFSASNPLINIKGRKGKQAIIMYAKSLLQRLNASKYQGQITITGRVELNPGMPIYVPIRNSMYYVETVDHAFVFGDRYVTTLHVSYGHKPWEFLPEILDFAANDDTYMTDAYLYNDVTPLSPQEAKEELNPGT